MNGSLQISLQDLRYFMALVEHGHFGKAAEQCFVSQPTLSGQIKKLEASLGVQLFERSNRKVLITEAGETLAEHAKRILQEVDRMVISANNLQNPLAGNFRLGAFPTLSTYIFPDLVPKLSQKLPELRLILIEEKTDQLLAQLKEGQIDAALLALPIHNDGLETMSLFCDEFELAVPKNHPLSQHKQIHYEMLAEHNVLLLEEGHCLRDQALDVCHLNNIKEEQEFRATGLETLRQMVKAGTGITFMPKIAIRDNDDGITYIPFRDPVPVREIGLVWRKSLHRQEVIDQIVKLIDH